VSSKKVTFRQPYTHILPLKKYILNTVKYIIFTHFFTRIEDTIQNYLTTQKTTLTKNR